ncbi:MAG: Rho termination factor N-terminal domain-containing protein [Eubacterium sp.]|nr:Rho termination factor N-terminal domain-containing protein [Eubacterium sp.]
MDYKKMKVAELRALAEEKGIRGVEDIKKNELVELLTNIDKMREAKAETGNKPEAKKAAAPKKEAAAAEKKPAAKNASKKKTASSDNKSEKAVKEDTQAPAKKSPADKKTSVKGKKTAPVKKREEVKEEIREEKLPEDIPEDTEEKAFERLKTVKQSRNLQAEYLRLCLMASDLSEVIIICPVKEISM